MQERAREGIEVLHDLLLAELLDVERLEAHARLLERRDDLVEVGAVADQDRLAADWRQGLGLHDVTNGRRGSQHRQLDAEDRALADLAIDRKGAPVVLHNAPAQ